MRQAAIILTGIFLFTLVQGCNGITTEEEDLGAEYGPEHPLDFVSDTADDRGDGAHLINAFGFSRHAGNEAGLDRKMSMHDIIDRQRVAEGISNLIVQSPDVDEAGVLITNEYALVAFRAANENKEDAAYNVKLMTESVIPYYYETVVTDNPAMIEDIEAFKSMDARSSGGHTALRQIVEDMKHTTKQPDTPKKDHDFSWDEARFS